MPNYRYVISIENCKIHGIPKSIEINKIYFDEYNPRISMYRDSSIADTGCKGLNQNNIEYALKIQPSFLSLKRSILENGGAIVPIWVINDKNNYIVIEGNTRLIIYKEIYKETNDQSYEKINAIVLDINASKITESIKNFIRLTCHLHGQTQWDKYEQAKYLYMLYYHNSYPTSKLSKITKLNEKDIKEDIKAFEIMSTQFMPKYGEGDPASVHKYSYFKEYVKDKKLLNVMENKGYDEKDFANWVGNDKFVKAQDVRKLRNILNDDEARGAFIEKDYDRAIEILKDVIPQKSDKLYILIDDLIDRIKKIKLSEIEELNSEKGEKRRKLIENLNKEVNFLLKRIK